MFAQGNPRVNKNLAVRVGKQKFYYYIVKISIFF